MLWGQRISQVKQAAAKGMALALDGLIHQKRTVALQNALEPSTRHWPFAWDTAGNARLLICCISIMHADPMLSRCGTGNPRDGLIVDTWHDKL